MVLLVHDDDGACAGSGRGPGGAVRPHPGLLACTGHSNIAYKAPGPQEILLKHLQTPCEFTPRPSRERGDES